MIHIAWQSVSIHEEVVDLQLREAVLKIYNYSEKL